MLRGVGKLLRKEMHYGYTARYGGEEFVVVLPEQLQGKQIPLLACIVGIMDAYRAMRSDRPYRKATTEKQAITKLRKGAGTQFDPRLVDLFIEPVENSPEDSDMQQAG